MPAGLARRARAQVLQSLVSGSYFAGLNVGDPGDAAANIVEPVIGTNGYARQSITWSAVSTPISGAAAVLQNSNVLTWTATGPWAAALTQPVSFVSVWNLASGTSEANYFGAGLLLPARLVNAGTLVITIPAGALQLTIGLEN